MGPIAAWWASDDVLFELESCAPPLLDVLLSHTWRAPVWLTAYDVSISEKVGTLDPNSRLTTTDATVVPIAVSPELQQMIERRSQGMNLVNGIHDSNGDQLLQRARQMVRSRQATPEAVLVAALRAGWRPHHMRDLERTLTRR